jgi:hypothetical protein
VTPFRLLVVIAIAGYGIHLWNHHSEQQALRALTTSAGFLPVPMPEGSARNTVIVFAPLNCPREGAQRARAMVQKLNDLGIANVLTDHYGAQVFEPNPETEAAFKRLNIVMTGDIPIVLFNGLGKANPTVEEVVAEVRRTQGS